ncbi:MAG: MvaI/BcnI family restriction endonuclease [Albidovulum sp.]|nr:MvaI/BcnI family restriction endonuclease [Albidovulum sp.]
MDHSRTLGPDAQNLLDKLRLLASMGPIPAIGHGDAAVGKTLLHYLDIPMTSLSKASSEGIVISARRGCKAKDLNRVNLFAKVPDWNISACKSTKEILDLCGYFRDGEHRLNCTVKSSHPNSQGLYLEVDRATGYLLEKQALPDAGSCDIVAWRISDLERRLIERQPRSAWVVAVPSNEGEIEHFHFRYVTFTSAPRSNEIAWLLEIGTVTVDHLICNRRGRIVEKGPLFKIKPRNVDALFPTSPKFDLLR